MSPEGAARELGVLEAGQGLPERAFVARLFDELSPRYDAAVLGYSLAQDLRWKSVLVRGLRPVAGERALDLACGTGLILRRLSRAVGPGGAIGADLNRPMLLHGPRGAGAAPLVHADAERLPFASAAFDIVTAGYLLKYVNLDRFLGEVDRVLRPGGRFGAYDFSRPMRGTVAGELYSIYLHRILPWAGRRVRGGAESWREVFDFLPRIAESSGWEFRIRDCLARTGFRDVEIVPSLGGAVTWVWARKAHEAHAGPLG